jgi:hypothetical protein
MTQNLSFAAVRRFKRRAESRRAGPGMGRCSHEIVVKGISCFQEVLF